MKVAYVDESGGASAGHQSRYCIVAAAMFDEDDLDCMESAVRGFKKSALGRRFAGSEIHAYDIMGGKGGFRGITESERGRILDGLYSMAGSLRFSAIAVAVDKRSLGPPQRTGLRAVDAAYGMLASRIDIHLGRIRKKGVVLLDMVSSRPHALGKTDIVASNAIRTTLAYGAGLRGTRTVIGGPQFVRSDEEAGIQVADLVAYCTGRRMNGGGGFGRYWDLVYPKFQAGADGRAEGFGLVSYPDSRGP